MQDQTFETTISTVASKATYSGAGTSVVGWVLSSEFTLVFGLLVAIGGFFVNWYYKYKEDKRQQAEHERRMGLYDY